MQIELNKEQFRNLLALAFLGEWVVNGSNTETQSRDELLKTADALYAMAAASGIDEWVERCQDCGEHHANRTMEEALMPYVDQYDEQTFWDALAQHLALRDVAVGDGASEPLSAEKELHMWHRKEQYDQEFRKHGLNNVRLVLSGGKRAR